jgi:hypothetical protein
MPRTRAKADACEGSPETGALVVEQCGCCVDFGEACGRRLRVIGGRWSTRGPCLLEHATFLQSTVITDELPHECAARTEAHHWTRSLTAHPEPFPPSVLLGLSAAAW